MIYRISIVAVATILSLQLSAQQIANGDFENWTVQSLFENPDEWQTPNGQAPGLINVTKVSGSAGAFAPRLETVVYDMDTVFGFVLIGEFDNDMPLAGVPFNTEIAAIEASLRYDILPNDTAFILFVGWIGGVATSQELIPISGSQNTWTAFSHSLTFGSVTPDSVLLAAASSNPFDNTFNMPGSWLEIDDIQLTSPNVPNPDVIPNQSFEDWSDVEVENPDSWNTLNELTQSFIGSLVTKSSDAAVGMYAVRMENALTTSGDSISSLLTNGSIEDFGDSGGVPYVASPQSMTGQYKWLPSGQDTGYISLQLLSNGMLVGTALFGLTQAVPNWTSFTQNITTIGTPDTMLITIISGFNPGSVLMLDDLNLTGGTVGVFGDGDDSNDIQIYPVPAQNLLNVKIPDEWVISQAYVADLSGKRVMELDQLDLMSPVNVGVLDPGVYFIQLHGPADTRSLRFVKE